LLNEAKRKPLYQPWNEEAFRADLHVGAMTSTQRWIYRTLCQSSFFCSTRPYLPDDDEELWLLAGCENPKQWERNKAVVRARFTPVELSGVRLLSQKRILADWQRIDEKRQTLAEAGRKGGRANAKQELSKCLADDSRGETNANQEKLMEVKRKEEKSTAAPDPGAGVVELPGWLPRKEWHDYLKMRKRIRKEATPEAITLAIRELETLKAVGNDPKLVLEQSILNSWQGLFALRVDFAAAREADRNRDAIAGKHDPARDRALTSEENVEMEHTRIELERWDGLEKGTLSVNPGTVAWATEKRDRLKRIPKLPAQDPRPRWLKNFLDKAATPEQANL
jgi:hypothetical protein